MDIHSPVVRASAFVIALGVLGTAATAWGLGDFKPILQRDLNTYADANKAALAELRQMAENATRLGMAAQFQVLYEKKLKCDCLSFEEAQLMCRLARELGYTGIPGC